MGEGRRGGRKGEEEEEEEEEEERRGGGRDKEGGGGGGGRGGGGRGDGFNGRFGAFWWSARGVIDRALIIDELYGFGDALGFCSLFLVSVSFGVGREKRARWCAR